MGNLWGLPFLSIFFNLLFCFLGLIDAHRIVGTYIHDHHLISSSPIITILQNMGRRATSWKRAIASALSSWPGIIAAIAASNGGLVIFVRKAAVGLLVGLLRLRKTVFLRTQGLVLGSVGSWLGSYVKHYIELLRWRSRVFYHRVHLVLLSWTPETAISHRVEKRTLFEGSLEQTIMNGNSAATKVCAQAAAQCSVENPFVTQHLPPGERYQILNNTLNLISSLTPTGHIAEDIYPTCTVGCWYVFALTVDKYASPDRLEIPDTKIRASLVKEETVLWLCNPENAREIKRLEEVFQQDDNERHLNRWRCLCKMAEIYQKQEEWTLEQHGDRVLHVFRVYLSVPMAPITSQSTVSTPRLSTARRKSLQATFQAQHPPIARHQTSDSLEDTSPPIEATPRRKDSGLDKTTSSPEMFSPWSRSARTREFRRTLSQPVDTKTSPLFIPDS